MRVCAWMWICVDVPVCAYVRAREFVRVCRIYIHCLLLLEKHRSSGSVLHFTPIVNTNIWSRCFCVAVLLFGIEVYASFDLVLDQTQAETLCDS